MLILARRRKCRALKTYSPAACILYFSYSSLKVWKLFACSVYKRPLTCRRFPSENVLFKIHLWELSGLWHFPFRHCIDGEATLRVMRMSSRLWGPLCPGRDGLSSLLLLYHYPVFTGKTLEILCLFAALATGLRALCALGKSPPTELGPRLSKF